MEQPLEAEALQEWGGCLAGVGEADTATLSPEGLELEEDGDSTTARHPLLPHRPGLKPPLKL